MNFRLSRPTDAARVRSSTLTLTALEDRCNPVTIGSFDPTFGTAGISTPLANGTSFNDTVQIGNGNFLAVGTDLNTNSFIVARFRADGSLDPSFGVNGVTSGKFQGAFSAGNGIAVDTDDGSIYIVGSAGGNFGIAKLNQTGAILITLDQGFGTGYNGVAVNSSTNQVYAVGNKATDFYIERFDANLTSINSKQISLGNAAIPDFATAVTIAADGRIFASVAVDGFSDFGLFRSEADLSSPTSQVYNLGGLIESAQGVKVSSATGDVFISGHTDAGGTVDVAVLKINPNVLTTFTTAVLSLPNNQFANRLDLDPFNRPVVAGIDFTNGAFVARFTTNLLPDTSFAANGLKSLGLPALSEMEGVFVDPTTGKITAVGTDSAKAAAIRLFGSTGLPNQVIVTGQPTGKGDTYPINTANFKSLSTSSTPVTLVPNFNGLVRAAQADVNGDGILDTIAVAGPGGGPRVVVINGRDGSTLADFFAYAQSYTGGLFVAAADFTGDGMAEVVVSPEVPTGTGFKAEIAVFDGKSMTGGTANPTVLARFLGLASLSGAADTTFQGGARVAVGDINGDGVPDLLVAAGNGGGPRVTVWNGKGFAGANGGNPTINPIANLFVFESTQRGGAFVAAGDVNGDGQADFIVSGGPGGGPRIRVADAKQLLALGAALEGVDFDQNLGLVIVNFFAGDPNSRGGVRLAAIDLDGDNKSDLVTGSGDNLNSQMRVYSGKLLLNLNPAIPEPTPDQTINPMYGVLANGIFVG
jgi:hypothetical protein